MRCRNNLDERQLLQRGNVFQHTLILLVVLLIANAFLKEEGIVWAEGMWENILIVWAAISLCFCEFIFLEIYPMGKGQTAFYAVLGIAGMAILGMSFFHLAAGTESLTDGYMLTSQGGMVLEAVFLIVIFLMSERLAMAASGRGRDCGGRPAFGNIWNAAGFLDGILGRFRLLVGVVGSCDADCKLCRETKKIVFLSFRSIAIIKSRN